MPTKRQMAGTERARRKVLDLYAGGHSLRVISSITGWGEGAVERLLESRGIRVDERRRNRPRELEERMNEKRPTRADFEEMQEQTERLRNMMFETAIREADERGEIARRAKERNIDYGDALVEFAEELEAPFKQIERDAEEKRLEREIGPRTPVVTLEEEAKACGVNPSEVRAHAKRYGLDPLDSLIALAGERGGEKVEETGTVELEERAEEDLDRRAWAYVQKHGVGYEEALTKTMEEGI